MSSADPLEGPRPGDADAVLRALDPEWPALDELIQRAGPSTLDALQRLARSQSQDEGQHCLWSAIAASVRLTQRGASGHVETARACLRALRLLRDYARLDRALTQQAVELSRLHRRLLEAPTGPLAQLLEDMLQSWNDTSDVCPLCGEHEEHDPDEFCGRLDRALNPAPITGVKGCS